MPRFGHGDTICSRLVTDGDINPQEASSLYRPYLPLEVRRRVWTLLLQDEFDRPEPISHHDYRVYDGHVGLDDEDVLEDLLSDRPPPAWSIPPPRPVSSQDIDYRYPKHIITASYGLDSKLRSLYAGMKRGDHFKYANWWRPALPGYPRRQDMSIMRTCRRTYLEIWNDVFAGPTRFYFRFRVPWKYLPLLSNWDPDVDWPTICRLYGRPVRGTGSGPGEPHHGLEEVSPGTKRRLQRSQYPSTDVDVPDDASNSTPQGQTDDRGKRKAGAKREAPMRWTAARKMHLYVTKHDLDTTLYLDSRRLGNAYLLRNLTISIRKQSWLDETLWPSAFGSKDYESKPTADPYRCRRCKMGRREDGDRGGVGGGGDDKGVERNDGDGGGSSVGDDESEWILRPKEKHVCWGRAFNKMPNLELLTLEFETGAVRRVELEALVTEALTWQFPLLDQRFHLAPHATPTKRVKRFSWRGMPDHVGLICSGCNLRINDTNAFRGQASANAGSCACPHARERMALKARGFGPRMLSSSVVYSRQPVPNPPPPKRPAALPPLRGVFGLNKRVRRN